MSDTIALTGGTGFIGRHVIAALLDSGFTVRALVRDRNRADTLDGVELITGSLEDSAALSSLCSGARAVIHIAGAISARHRAEFDAVNVDGTARLVAAAVERAVGRFVLVSSLAAREPTLSDYGASKRAGEHVLRDVGRDLSWSILRPPAVYGPGDRGTLPLIRQLTRRLAIVPGDKNCRFSLIFIEDLAQAIVAMVRDGAPAGQIHEIDDGVYGGYSWRDLALVASRTNGRTVRCLFIPRMVADIVALGIAGAARLMGRIPEIGPGKVAELYHHDWVCRNNPVEAATSWRAVSDFGAGFPVTVDWYKGKGWL